MNTRCERALRCRLTCDRQVHERLVERAEQRVLAGNHFLTQSRFLFVFNNRFFKSRQNLFDRRVQPLSDEEPELLDPGHVRTDSRDSTATRRLLTAS